MSTKYKTWIVNLFPDRDPVTTVTEMLVTVWDNGNCEIAFRSHTDGVWGPPRTAKDPQ